MSPCEIQNVTNGCQIDVEGIVERQSDEEQIGKDHRKKEIRIKSENGTSVLVSFYDEKVCLNDEKLQPYVVLELSIYKYSMDWRINNLINSISKQ